MVLLINSIVNAKYIQIDKLNKDQKIIQLGIYKTKVKLKNTLKKYNLDSKYDIYIEKINNYTAYIANYKYNKISTDIKRIYPDSFFISFNNIKASNKKINNKKEYKNIATNNIKYISLKKAIDLYNNKKYNQSIDMLNKLFKNDMKNDQINFYLARNYFKQKDYNKAISVYERILINNYNSTAEFEIARSYFKQGNLLESKKIFTYLKQKTNSENLKYTIDQYLQKIEEKRSKHSFDGIIMLGSSYDSNLENRASSDWFNIGDSKWENTTSKHSSIIIDELFLIHYKYNLKKETTFNAKTLYYKKIVLDYSENNLDYIQINPYFNTKLTSKLDIDYGVYFNRIWYTNRLFLNIYGINGSINMLNSNNSLYKVQLNYNKKKNQIKSNEYKDLEHFDLSISNKKKYSEIIYYTPTLQVTQERKNSGNSSVIDYDAVSLKFDLKYLLNKYLLNSNISYTLKNYKDKNSLYSIKQKDNILNFSLSGIYQLNNEQTIQSTINYIKNNSNIDSSNYNKFKLNLYLINKF